MIITELNTNPKKIIFAVRIDNESKIIGKSIQNLNLPRNTSVILIIRSNGLTDIPSNEKTIQIIKEFPLNMNIIYTNVYLLLTLKVLQ